ncbi:MULTISPECIES: hypothetical protein [Corallincola]|nr:MULTISPECIES: hypothetical protein [Corallincola]TAA47133.1 hypothetical protein EXY25_07780 [Corallincola spongiicola]TCI04790.1 hypothetical protein EZV61_02125 [Corallincola luteus]
MPLSYAEQPTRGFNRLISESEAKQENWVKDSEQVALHYLGNPDELEILQQQGDGKQLELTVRQPLDRAGVESALYLLQLKKTAQGTWQLQNARMAWRCKNSSNFDTRRCQANY